MPRAGTPFEAARLQGQLWTPKDAGSGLSWWIEVGDLRYCTASAGTITGVTNRSGTSPNWQSVVSAPSYVANGLNGRPSMYFNGSVAMTTNAPVTTGSTMCGVMACQVETGSGNRLWSAPANGNSDFAGGQNFIPGTLDGGTGVYCYYGGTTNGATMEFDKPGIFAFQFAPVSGQTQTLSRWNGVSGSTSLVGPISLSANDVVVAAWDTSGTGDAAARFKGYLGGMAVYVGADAAEVCKKLEGYFAHSWGYPHKLTPTHPYRHAPPLIGG